LKARMYVKQKAIRPHIDIDDICGVAHTASGVLQNARSSMLAPESKKSPPTFNSGRLAELCGLEMNQVQYLAKKGDLPSGGRGGTSRREWTLAEARQWVRTIKFDTLRDAKRSAATTITVANFKGGVTKTTTAAALAQGLSLLGHKVLVIDTDPQGSLTTLFGVVPDTEVEVEQTILPMCTGETDSIMSAIRPTYWDGIDLVAAAPVLFNAEFVLPARQKNEPGFAFWRVLDAGLEDARDTYDIIIIDTPPSLSYITINALLAAEGIVMPLPPNALDFASSTQFWSLFGEVCKGLFQAGENKKFSFVDIVLSRVDRADQVSLDVREWIVAAYGAKVLPMEIPKTSIAATASIGFGTVYDLDSSSAQAKTLKRARDAYDQLVNHVAAQARGVWEADIESMARHEGKIAGSNVAKEDA